MLTKNVIRLVAMKKSIYNTEKKFKEFNINNQLHIIESETLLQAT